MRREHTLRYVLLNFEGSDWSDCQREKLIPLTGKWWGEKYKHNIHNDVLKSKWNKRITSYVEETLGRTGRMQSHAARLQQMETMIFFQLKWSWLISAKKDSSQLSNTSFQKSDWACVYTGHRITVFILKKVVLLFCFFSTTPTARAVTRLHTLTRRSFSLSLPTFSSDLNQSFSSKTSCFSKQWVKATLRCWKWNKNTESK